MKFTIARSKFLEGLKAVQNIVNSKSPNQILQNVSMKAANNLLTMTTTDLDISIRYQIDCEVNESGATTLPAKFLCTAVDKLAEGNVDVSVDENERALISVGFTDIKLAGLPESDFPPLPVDEDSYTYNVPQQTLREMLRKTYYAASQDDTRRSLKGVLMSFKDSKLTMVATDGKRLALVENEIEFPADAEKDIVLPTKTVQELIRSLSGDEEMAKIKVQQTQICFNLGNRSIYSKLMEDKYPNYTQVIPQEFKEQVTIDRQMLINAIDRASVMTMDESHSVRLVFDQNTLVVSSAESEMGQAKDEVAIKYAGEHIEIMFNPQYIMDPLKAIDDDEVSINLNNGHSPAMIRCSIPFIYVLMPLRTN